MHVPSDPRGDGFKSTGRICARGAPGRRPRMSRVPTGTKAIAAPISYPFSRTLNSSRARAVHDGINTELPWESYPPGMKRSPVRAELPAVDEISNRM